MDTFIVAVSSVWTDSGFVNFNWGNGVMILVGLLLLYMAFALSNRFWLYSRQYPA